MEWVVPSDVLLVLERNENGVVADSAVPVDGLAALPDNPEMRNGYTALTKMNANTDGLIDHIAALEAQINGNWMALGQSPQITDGLEHDMTNVAPAAAKAASLELFSSDLQSQVSVLVQAISSFDTQSAAAFGQVAGGLTSPDTDAAFAVSGGLFGVMDILRQFDVNGSLLADIGGVMGVSADAKLPGGAEGDIAKMGYLASGKS